MVARMGRFEHGGDIYTADGSRSDVVDFSSNLNPLGMPDEVAAAVRNAVPSFDVYPDPETRALRAAIAAHHGIPVDWVVCTAGASDLIERICQVVRPRTALVTAPCFSGYEQALERVGAHIVRIALQEQDDFAVRVPRLCSLVNPGMPAISLGFLCNPNNPTGMAVKRTELLALLEDARVAGAVVALDESFLEFTDEPSAVELCAQYPNLVVIRAFTKLYAMAGLRLGYGICADVARIRCLQEAGQPWAVSTPAQVAGTTALSVPEWAARTRAFVARERAILARGLKRLGLRVVPGTANYLLFQSPAPLYEPLLDRGILVRRCENYEGLDVSWYRVAIRDTAENAMLLAAIADALKDGEEVSAWSQSPS